MLPRAAAPVRAPPEPDERGAERRYTKDILSTIRSDVDGSVRAGLLRDLAFRSGGGQVLRAAGESEQSDDARRGERDDASPGDDAHPREPGDVWYRAARA